MSLSPASFSGQTAGAVARMGDPAAMSQQEVQLVASGDKVTGGRRRKTGRKGARKSARKSRKAIKRTRRSAKKMFSIRRPWFM